MPRGKSPPIKITLNRAQKVYFATYGRLAGKLEPSESQKRWIEENCFLCKHRNIERMVTSVLSGEEQVWKHICAHRGPTAIIPLTSRSQGLHNCSGFELEPGKDDKPVPWRLV